MNLHAEGVGDALQPVDPSGGTQLGCAWYSRHGSLMNALSSRRLPTGLTSTAIAREPYTHPWASIERRRRHRGQ